MKNSKTYNLKLGIGYLKHAGSRLLQSQSLFYTQERLYCVANALRSHFDVTPGELGMNPPSIAWFVCLTFTMFSLTLAVLFIAYYVNRPGNVCLRVFKSISHIYQQRWLVIALFSTAFRSWLAIALLSTTFLRGPSWPAILNGARRARAARTQRHC